MPALSLAIFDCDGVLVDSEIIAARVEADLLKETIGYEISAQELAARFAGLKLERIVEIITEESGAAFPHDFIQRIDKEMDVRLGRDVEAIAGVAEMLERIDLPRCIASNSSTARLELMLRHVGLWDSFRPYVFSAPEVGTGRVKPAPDVYLFACQSFGVQPGEAVVIEDSVHGAAAAVAAGCRVVGFTGGTHTYPGHAEALTDAGAMTVIARLRDYPAVIEALSQWEES